MSREGSRSLAWCLAAVLIFLYPALPRVGATSESGEFYPSWELCPYPPYPVRPAVPDNPVLTADDVTDIGAQFVADPFLFFEDGVWYMFFEVYWNRGSIALATSQDGLNWNYDRIVILELHHLSYPFVFKSGDDHYMLLAWQPNDLVVLYRASDFPYGWTSSDTLLTGRRIVDPSLVQYEDRFWMFGGSSDSRDCLLFYSDFVRSGWVEHPLSPIIVNDPSKARPGGRPVVIDGDRLFRFAQKGDVCYGEAIRAFEVDLLSPTEYIEHEIPESPIIFAQGSGWNSDAMHTFDPWWTGNRWIAAVDGWGEEFGWSIGIYRTEAVSSAGDAKQIGSASFPFLEIQSSNPFRSEVQIAYGYEGDGGPVPARLSVHDFAGRRLGTLLDQPLSPGTRQMIWQPLNRRNGQVVAGTYFLRLECGGRSTSRKLILMR